VKILIIRLSSIGDIVLTTPVVRCLNDQLPNATIHFLTKPQFRELLTANPYLHKIHTLKTSFNETLQELTQEKFDYIIDLHKNLRSLKLKAFLNKTSFTFNKINWEKFLMVNLKVDYLPRMHIVDRYMAAVQSLNVTKDEQGLDYFIPENQEFDLSKLPEVFQTGFYVWMIGAKHYTKRFPENRIATLLQKFETPVVLLGGPEDQSTGEELAQTRTNIINYCGQLTIHESATLVKNAQKVLTNDTGIMHIAAAFQKPIVSFWGNTTPKFGMRPYYGTHQKADAKSIELAVTDLHCRPCSKLGFQKCPKGHFRCMHDIPEQTILNAIDAPVED